MSLPLSNSSDLTMRKDLIRLRMEMNRQQILYHSQPLAHPFQRIKGMVANRATGADQHIPKAPLMVAATLAMTLFGRRLGKVGKLARLGLLLYPVIRKLRH
ncbi:hypothetical protein GYM54_00910 [Pseudomonas sp. MTM4]|uniref:hypothetical protein n=1 Tax=unclassified Pseudomonas TaxID=196821 RepID=UPI00103AD7F2|nr:MULTISPECIES: hypothetical protein [unclassified Pseudomonas]MBC8648301.1 hypothetical protein [Pseudomonas sp. MT4]QXY90254.1 hypothetical protein GYM54_00910 [Pseudomonas sp. MTM4]TCD24209.1 hypothetical protein E0D86_03095 [Pseudomonas sp. IC_126]